MINRFHNTHCDIAENCLFCVIFFSVSEWETDFKGLCGGEDKFLTKKDLKKYIHVCGSKLPVWNTTLQMKIHVTSNDSIKT